MELEDLLATILDQLSEVVSYDAASIMILEEDTLRIIAYRGPIPRDQALQIKFHRCINHSWRGMGVNFQIRVVGGDKGSNAAFQEEAQQGARQGGALLWVCAGPQLNQDHQRAGVGLL